MVKCLLPFLSIWNLSKKGALLDMAEEILCSFRAYFAMEIGR
jgi:hypothetical protein